MLMLILLLTADSDDQIDFKVGATDFVMTLTNSHLVIFKGDELHQKLLLVMVVKKIQH